MPWPGCDWMAGLGGQKPEFPEPSLGLFPLYRVVIPELQRAGSLLEWKLMEDMWPHQEWLLLYFSHPKLFLIAMATACEGKCAEGRC